MGLQINHYTSCGIFLIYQLKYECLNNNNNKATENSKALCVFLLKIQSVHVRSFSCPQYLNLNKAIHGTTWVFFFFKRKLFLRIGLGVFYSSCKITRN